MTKSNQPLRLNVGFVVAQSIGYTRKFEFEIPQISFSPELDFRDLTGLITVSRTTEGLLVQVQGQAVIGLECGLCLDAFEQTLAFEFVELYAFPGHAKEESELILPDDFHIDLQPLVQEYIELELPIRPRCKPDCQGLCPICGNNRNEQPCTHTAEPADPRLGILRELLDDHE